MCRRNVMTWKKKWKMLMINKLYMKQYCLIVWNVEKMLKVEIQKFQELKMGE